MHTRGAHQYVNIGSGDGLVLTDHYLNWCSSGFMMLYGVTRDQWVNTLRPRQDGCHFADDIFMCIFVNENCCILIKFSLKYVRKGPIDNNPALVQIMAWHWSGDKPLSEPMMVILLMHLCVTRPQWVSNDMYVVVGTDLGYEQLKWFPHFIIFMWYGKLNVG